MIGLVLSLMFFIFFLGLFAFDANRAQMCQRELIAACDASSIAGTAMLTSFDTSPGNTFNMSLSTAQQSAGAYAHNMFTKQVVLGKALSNATLTTSSTALYSVSTPGQCNDLVALGDPSNGFSAVNVGDPKGRTVMVFCCYGYQPSFLAAIPFLQNFIPLNASSFAGIPQVDAVVVFDYSGSMDDFTSVLFVRREWFWPNGPLTNTIADIGCPMYTVVIGQTQAGQNYLSSYIGWNWTNNQAGTDCNVLPPQNLEDVASPTALNGAITNPLYFAPQLRSNPIFCPFFLGTNLSPVQSMNAATQAPSAQIVAGVNLPAQTTTAYQLTTSSWFKHYYSPGGANLDGKLAPTDYASPPGNYKPVFVSGDGITSLTPVQFCNQYDFRNASGSSMAATVPTEVATRGSNNVWTYGYPPLSNSCNRYAQTSSGGPSASNSQYAYHLDQTTWLPTGVDRQNFTDLVVNLVNPVNSGEYFTEPIPSTGNSVLNQFYFTGFTFTFPADEQNPSLKSQAFNFDSLATLVEASRGNLDSTTNQQLACCDGHVIINEPPGWSGVGNPPTVTYKTIAAPATANFQLAYQRLAMIETQPYATACDGAVNAFFYKMATLCDARFGFVGFSATADSNASDNVDGASVNGGCAVYSGSDKNFESVGTSPGDSFYRSGLCMLPTSSLGLGTSVFSSNTGKVMDLSVVQSSGSATNNAVNGYNGGSGGQDTSGGQNQTGFKIPRTCLTASSSGAQPSDQRLDMVSSATSAGAPMNNSTLNATQSPYPNGLPYGDVWSAPANSNIGNGVWNGRPLGGTYCDEALSTAYNSFINNTKYASSTRKAARKAIVFFTDGEPTGGIAGPVGTNANTVAGLCQPKSIVMYTIGLNAAGNTTLAADQKAFLGDNVTNSSGPGLAYLAGNGGRFFPCGTGSDVRNAFASIARRLSQSQN